MIKSELGRAIPIVPGGSEEDVRLVKALLGIKNEIDKRDTVVLSSPNQIVPMPDMPAYRAGDMETTITELRRINAIMFEFDMRPNNELRQVSYGFQLTLQAVSEGIKLHRDSSSSVMIHHTTGSEPEDFFGVERFTGSRAARIQELIVNRATRQLGEQGL